jgi:DNA-binding beta-propeller fold protein YncE
MEFDQAGNVIRAWGGPGQGYDWPTQEHGMRIDPKGFVWFGGNGKDDGMILKFTQDGKFVKQFGKRGPSKGSLDGTQFGKPADFWFDAKANEVYVADGYTNHRVIVMDMDTGAVKRIWGAYGNKPEDPSEVAGQEGTPYDPKAPPSQQFNNPVHCVKITVDNLVYVCDRSNDRLQVFRKDGTFVKEFIYLKDTLRGSVWDVYPWPDAKQRYLIMVDGGNNEMRVIRRSDGKILSTWGRQGRQAGEFHWVHNVAIDRNGNVYTSEVDNAQRLQRWVPTSGAPNRAARQ